MLQEDGQVDETVSISRLIQQILWVGVFLLAFFAMPLQMSSNMQIAEVDSEISLEMVVDQSLEGSMAEVGTE